MKSLSNIAIIQARVGSKRLPNKMLLNLGKYKLIEWVLLRLKKSKKINKIILAIPSSKENEPLHKIAIKHKIDLFRGEEKNVLSRFLKSVDGIKNANIIRVCADNPFIDSNHVDLLIKYFLSKNVDFAYNHRPLEQCNYPDGFGAEIFKLDTLVKISKKNLDKSHREHVTKYFYDNSIDYKIDSLRAKKNLSFPKLKFDIDSINDLNYINNLILSKEILLYDSAEEIIKKTIN